MPHDARILARNTGALGPQDGFTFIELVAALAIVGILTYMALTAYNPEDFSAPAEAQTLENHLRYAQVLAMSDTQVWGLNIGTDTYTLVRNCTSQNDINLPGLNSPTYNVPKGEDLFPNTTVTFNSRGQPSNCNGDPATGDITINIQKGNVDPIIITKNTGFIQ